MDKVEFTKKMRKTHTILLPAMLDFHFEILKYAFISCGYKIDVLKNSNNNIPHIGLSYAHNDICYPAILIIGQMIDALNSGDYDTKHIALLLPQAGGGCRASNYIHLLRSALKKAGYENIPVISLNISGVEKNSGFKITLPLIRKSLASICYSDLLMLLFNQIHPYEVQKKSTMGLVEKWQKHLSEQICKDTGYSRKEMKANYYKIISDFKEIAVNITPKLKVGIVGELYIKFCSLGNNSLEKFLENENCEYMMSGFSGYGIYVVDGYLQELKLYDGNRILKFFAQKIRNYIEDMQNDMIMAVEQNSDFIPQTSFHKVKEGVKDIISYGTIMGDGWLISAEIMDLINIGYENIICAQPFGCLPNHICGKGILNKIKQIEPRSNIVPIDYDSSDTTLNQENRIKLMLEIAKQNKKSSF